MPSRASARSAAAMSRSKPVATRAGLNAAVGSSGRVTSVEKNGLGEATGGTLVQTGGGDLDVRIGGRINPDTTSASYGVLTNARGDLTVPAAAIGSLQLSYGNAKANDPRAEDPYSAGLVRSVSGGVTVVTGDGSVALRSLGDLVLSGVGDAGRVRQSRFKNTSDENAAEHATRFSLWRPNTAIDLFAAGGNLLPLDSARGAPNLADTTQGDTARFFLPPTLRATAASGSIYYGSSAFAGRYLMAPSPYGQLELLAGGSIHADARALFLGNRVDRFFGPARWLVSGQAAGPNNVSNPFKPGAGFFIVPNDEDHAPLHADDPDPIRIYAATGDLTGVLLGYAGNDRGALRVAGAAKAAHVCAGRDIVNFGNELLYGNLLSSAIFNMRQTDVSLLSAGRDIFYPQVRIAGPGSLDMIAGRNLYLGDKGSIVSIGPIVTGDTRPGASILMQAGAGPDGPNYAALLTYLDPKNLAAYGTPLVEQPGKVAYTYENELAAWLKQRFKYDASDDADARLYFGRLASEQQAIFLRDIYFNELRNAAGLKQFRAGQAGAARLEAETGETLEDDACERIEIADNESKEADIECLLHKSLEHVLVGALCPEQAGERDIDNDQRCGQEIDLAAEQAEAGIDVAGEDPEEIIDYAAAAHVSLSFAGRR